MEKLTLVSPSMDWAKEILAYKEAFEANTCMVAAACRK